MNGKAAFQLNIKMGTELYLLLPIVLWLLGWVQVWLSVPLVLVLFYFAWKHCRVLKCAGAGDSFALSLRHGFVYAVLSALAVFCAVSMAG